MNISKSKNNSDRPKPGEGVLDEEKSRLETIFQYAPDGIILMRLGDKKFLIANHKMCEMLDYSEDELRQMSIQDIHPPEALPSIMDQVKKLLNKEMDYVHNIPVITKNKALIYTDVSAASIVLNGEQYAVGIFRDMTGHKMADDALVASEEKYRTLLENIQDAIFIMKDGKVRYANDVFARMLNYTIEELIGKGIEEIVAPEDLARVSNRYERRMKGEHVPTEYEFKVLKKDQVTRLDVRMSVGIIRYEGGQAALGTGKDITEQKRIEEELRKKEARLRYAQAQAHLGNWEINIAAKTYSWSEEMFRIFGYSSAGGVPEIDDYDMSIYPDDRERIKSNLSECIAEHKPFQDECRIVKPDGSMRWVEGRGKPIFDYKGNMVQFAGTLQDITERKLIEHDLRESEKNFHRTIDESPLGVRIVTMEGETIYANKAILDMYGYESVEELKKTSVKERYTPESYAEYQKRKEARLREEGPSEYEISIFRKNGEIRHLQVFRKEIFWSGKQQSQIIYQDITERKKAEEKLELTLENLQQSVKATIQVLGMASEARDPYTAGHHKRVSDLALTIAKDMGLCEDKMEGLRMAGSIHDIGKLSVPAEILSKPTKLTDLEFSMIKEHSQSGYEMLKHVESPWPLAQIVQQHHERMNGTGYPNNLQGDDIILEARIIAVADVVEAMASHRPYRPALGIEPALEEIEKNKGVLYDTNVVDTCLTLFREKGYKFI